MTESIPDKTLNLLKTEDDFKNKAPLYILYDKLNSVSNTYNISTSCTKLNSNNVIQPCRVLEETLKKWTIDSTLTNPEIVTDVTKYCTHVVYWLYGKIIDIQLNNSDINSLYSNVPKLLKSKFSKDINLNIKKVYNKKTLKNKKELYDFLESYDTIEGIIKGGKSKHKEAYCKYIKYIFDLYNNIHQDYNSIQSGYYDEEIKKFEDKFKNGENKFSILSNKCPKDYLYSVINRVNETFQNSGQKKPKTNDKITFESFNAIKEKIKKCYNKNFFNLGIDQLAYKKQLYEFVENYPIIKKELETAGNTDKKEYCDYIKDIFGLYKKVSHPYTSYGYNEEINSFNKKFLKNYREFHFLNEKCPGNCLHLVFNNNYKDLCLSEEQLKYVQDVPTSCTSAENSTADPIGIPDYNLDFYNHYNGFDDNSNLSEYAKFCNKMDSFWSKYTNGKNFCYQIVRNLINLSLSQQDGRDERCLYFTYWIYDTIWKHFGKGYNDTCVSDVIHMLLNFVSRINRDLVNTICYLEYYSDVSLKEWKEMKYLHDYFKGYSSFTNGNFNDDGKKQKLCDYITHANKLYKEHIQKCCVCVNKPKFSCYDKCPNNYEFHFGESIFVYITI
ncbi:hypothetical protein PVMG_02769 [Plasmodium vivax Mauritania I]|uniref:Uncharacterized protein n=1 Tax=Plasmodium vivax Mauritania I TaxID=1035515 RepID=A0A0J9TH04_PLAVI|nr:hypothetical protein PVMG_02769 [Plasmodium vivax Mauritania I]